VTIPQMNEKRIAPRNRVLKGGTIGLAGGGVINCMVRNISSTGAALEVETPMGVPDDFELVILADHFKRHCHVQWRKGQRLGVTFI
jgi:hypothetical protein